jgi:hypothetical protein
MGQIKFIRVKKNNLAQPILFRSMRRSFIVPERSWEIAPISLWNGLYNKAIFRPG